MLTVKENFAGNYITGLTKLKEKVCHSRILIFYFFNFHGIKKVGDFRFLLKKSKI